MRVRTDLPVVERGQQTLRGCPLLASSRGRRRSTGGLEVVVMDHALLFHTQPLLDIRAVPPLEHHRLDARELEQPREHEPGRPGADDGDLGAGAEHDWTARRYRGLAVFSASAIACSASGAMIA